MLSFEYKTAKADGLMTAQQLNDEFGPDGWELVTVIVDAASQFWYYFKREKEK